MAVILRQSIEPIALTVMKYFLQAALTLAVIFSAGQSAAQQAAQPVELRVDSASPAAAVARHFGWLESGLAASGVSVRWADDGRLDFASADGAAALKARAAGNPVKAVYVLWRDTTGNDQLLLVSEAFLAQRPQEARAVVAAFERARKWIAANPEEAARVLAPGAAARNLSGSRPGPAQLAALGNTAKTLGIDPGIAAQLLDDSLVRAVIVGAVGAPAQGSLGW